MNITKSHPDNWVIKPLGEACKTIKGKKPKDSGPASSERTVPYINIKAFETGQPIEFAAPGNYPMCERDDVLMVWDGARAGLSGRAVPGYIGSTLAKVYSDATDNRYLFYFLQSQYDRINSRTKGVGIPHVDPAIFNNIQFPIAPLDQQKHIVAEIEKQFSRLDDAVANLKRVKANLKRYKASVLKAAVEGRLVETEAEITRREGRSYETGEQLLQRILETRRSQWQGKGKYKEPAAPDTTDLPELPEGWVWSNFESVANRVTVGHVGSMKEEYVDDGVPFLRSQNIRPNRYSSEGLKFISQAFHTQLAKSSLRPGDIAVVRSGSVGVSCVIPDTLPEANCSDLVIIKSPQAVLPDFGAYYMNSVVETRVAAGKVGIALTHFNTMSVALLPLPIPPLAEQHRIVTEVERHLSLIQQAETQVDTNLQRAYSLRQSILANSFNQA